MIEMTEIIDKPFILSTPYKLPVTIVIGEGALKKGTILYQIASANTLNALVGTSGITDSVPTIPLKSGHSGALLANTIIQIGTELIKVGSMSGDNLLTCTRGVNGSVAAAHSADAPIIIIADDVAPKFKVWDGLDGHNIECVIDSDVDATSADVNTSGYFHCMVNRNACITASTELAVPTGFDKNSNIQFETVEE